MKEYETKLSPIVSRGNERKMVLSIDEMGAYFGMKGVAVSQPNRGLKETLKGDKELREILSKIKEELPNVGTCPRLILLVHQNNI